MQAIVTCACGWEKTADGYSKAVRKWEAHLKKCAFRRASENTITGQKNLFETGEKDDMINRSRYAGDPILRAKDLKHGETYTIDWFEEIKSALRDKPIQPAIRLNGFDKFLPLNITNLDTLLDAFGNDEEKWKGQKIVVSIIGTATPTGDAAEGIRISIPKKSK